MIFPCWLRINCERLLETDFRETSNIVCFNDSGVVIDPETNLIQKIRFGSSAASTSLEKGDRIQALDGEVLPDNPQDSYNLLSNLLETSAMRDVVLTVQKANGEIVLLNYKECPIWAIQ